MPPSKMATAARMVMTVEIENAAVTSTTPEVFATAQAPSIRGMSDSQGPKIKIVNKIHGVTCFFFDDW